MKTSRRSFLATGIGLPALLQYPASAQPKKRASEVGSVVEDSSFDPWIEIYSNNLRHNVGEISRRVASRPILAVIKNNGYGMGVTNIAQLLEPQPEIAGFAVVKLHEAMSLHDAGVRKPVLLLGPFDDKNLEDAAPAASCLWSTRRLAIRWTGSQSSYRGPSQFIFVSIRV